MVTAHPDTENGIKEVPNPIRNLNFVVVVVVVKGSVGQDGVAVGRRTSSGLLREMNWFRMTSSGLCKLPLFPYSLGDSLFDTDGRSMAPRRQIQRFVALKPIKFENVSECYGHGAFW